MAMHARTVFTSADYYSWRAVNGTARKPSKSDVLLNDLRFAWRNAIRRPAFTLLVVLTLALGIGVNSAVFALLDAVLVRPLPYRDPSSLVFMWQTLPRLNVAEVEATPFDYAAWQGLRTVPQVAMLQYGSFTI